MPEPAGKIRRSGFAITTAFGRVEIAAEVPVRAEAGGLGEDEGGVVVEYNDPRWLAERHGVPVELVEVLAGVEGLVAGVAG